MVLCARYRRMCPLVRRDTATSLHSASATHTAVERGGGGIAGGSASSEDCGWCVHDYAIRTEVDLPAGGLVYRLVGYIRRSACADQVMVRISRNVPCNAAATLHRIVARCMIGTIGMSSRRQCGFLRYPNRISNFCRI